jgi:hypothetical protein
MPDTNAANGDIYQVIVKHTLFAQAVLNVLWFKAVGTPTVETDLLIKYKDDLIAELYPELSGNLRLFSITARRVIPSLALDIVHVPASSTGPTSFLSALPPQIAVVVNVRSQRPGRSGLGRIYVCGLWQGGDLNGQLQPDRLTGIQQWAALLKTHFIDSTDANRWELGVFSRKIGGASLPFDAAGWSKAYALSVQPILATMRSRRVGQGS